MQVFKGFPQLDIHNKKYRVMCQVLEGKNAMKVAVFSWQQWGDQIEL